MPARSMTLFLLSFSLNATLSAQTLVSSKAATPRLRILRRAQSPTNTSERRLSTLSLAGGPEESRSFRLDESAKRLHAVGSRPHSRAAKNCAPASRNSTTPDVRVRSFQSYGGHWFYLKRTPGEDNRNSTRETEPRPRSASCWIRRLSPPTACTTRSITTAFARWKTGCRRHLARRLREQRPARA